MSLTCRPLLLLPGECLSSESVPFLVEDSRTLSFMHFSLGLLTQSVACGVVEKFQGPALGLRAASRPR